MILGNKIIKQVISKVDSLKKELVEMVQSVVRIESVNPTAECVDYDREVGGESRVN